MDKIAIIGLACLFPDATNPQEFWQNLMNQKDSTALATVEDFGGVDPSLFYAPEKAKPDKTYSLKGGYIRNFAFDSDDYQLSSDVINGLDPIFKGSLYVAKQALKNSGYLEQKQILAHCGAILGNLSFPTQLSNQLFAPIYQHTIESALSQLLQCDRFHLASSAHIADVSPYNAMTAGMPSAIVAHALALGGVHFSLDAACSSSLYAIDLACEYLRSHKTDLMLAGAISYADPLYIRMLFSGVQAYPDNGISRPLDRQSKGLTPSTGIGMVVLKRYSDALRDGDRIHAVISGIGLSNDGRGKHLLSPNQHGQLVAFERAYAEAGISPKEIDYLECHATGTLLGDTTELNSIDNFFGRYQSHPLIGSVKSNVGHLLTAAGMVSLIKILLSMAEDVIPPTIHLSEPVESPNKVITAAHVVQNRIPWHQNSGVKRAAINAFGFGGTNAHLILEEADVQESGNRKDKALGRREQASIAIIGMDAFFGACDGLDAFERSIYEGTQHFVPLPVQRWKGIEEQQELLKNYGFDHGVPKGAYISEFAIDTLRSKIPPNEVDTLNPQQLLMLKVADRALKDSGLPEGGNVAVIIAMETEPAVHQLQQRWNLSWQIEQGLAQAGLSLSPEKLSQLQAIAKDSIHPAAGTNEHVGYVGNIVASRISSLWDFNGPAFTLSAGENSTFKALEIAQLLLSCEKVDAVVIGAVDLAGSVESVLLRNQLAAVNTGINTLSFDQKANGWMIGEGAGAVVLKRLDVAQHEQKHIYAAIAAISSTQPTSKNGDHKFPSPVNPESVMHACQHACTSAGINPAHVNYLEVSGSGSHEDEAEMQGLIQAFDIPESDFKCALGSIKANIGHTHIASGMASLIKTALCLYHRYIPAVPQWTSPKLPEIWRGSPFYVATQSQPWFLREIANSRIAAINSIGIDGTCTHVILSEEISQPERCSRYLEQMPLHLFAIAASDQTSLLEQLDALYRTVESCDSLPLAASQTFASYRQQVDLPYALAILGRNKEELQREIQRTVEGVKHAFHTGEDWKTPLGSYFTAKPLGKQGKVAFVYPGAFGAYVGLGQTSFRLFPKIFDDIIFKTLEGCVNYVEKFLYPKSLNKLSLKQIEKLENLLIGNPLAMLEAEVACAGLTTAILKDYFQLIPDCVLGYSLGETSMMIAQGVWGNVNRGVEAFYNSPLFSDRLSGSKNAAREYWGLSTDQELEEDFWSTYVLIASVSEIEECLKQEERVYLTQINTPQEAVIAGDTKGCQRVIEALGCSAFRAPFNHLIHCPSMTSEYDELVKLNTFPVQGNPKVNFYLAADYKPITFDSESIGRNIAKNLCEQFNFPRLINRVYKDGARIFIEAGAGSTCSRWIGEILKQKEHVAEAANRRGMDDYTTMLRLIAKLLSHRVAVDLSSLYCQFSDANQPKAIMRTIQLGGRRISSTILSEPNQALFKDIELYNARQWSSQLKDERAIATPPTNSKSNLASNQANAAPAQSVQQLDSFQTHYQKLSKNNSHITQNHTNFLKTRQESLQQISELIQFQITFSEQYLKSKTAVLEQSANLNDEENKT